jgi:Leucine-rich repeat (LRR) protein
MGNISHSLENLVQLSQLDISHNQLTGSVPFIIVNLLQCVNFVDLNYNFLSGEMHFKLMNETRLTHLYLNNNWLTGPITFGPMNLMMRKF